MQTLLKRSKSKLVGKCKAHLRVLQHMVEAQVLDHVVRRVDLLIRQLELGLDHESRRVAILASGRVIGAGVTAFGFNVGDVAILELVSLLEEKKQATHR